MLPVVLLLLRLVAARKVDKAEPAPDGPVLRPVAGAGIGDNVVPVASVESGAERRRAPNAEPGRRIARRRRRLHRVVLPLQAPAAARLCAIYPNWPAVGIERSVFPPGPAARGGDGAPLGLAQALGRRAAGRVGLLSGLAPAGARVRAHVVHVAHVVHGRGPSPVHGHAGDPGAGGGAPGAGGRRARRHFGGGNRGDLPRGDGAAHVPARRRLHQRPATLGGQRREEPALGRGLVLPWERCAWKTATCPKRSAASTSR